jgi:hypothetical protein
MPLFLMLFHFTKRIKFNWYLHGIFVLQNQKAKENYYIVVFSLVLTNM